MPSSTQATVNASVGTGYNGSQNANAAQYAALLAQQEQQAERVDGAGAKHAETLAREAAAMDASARGALAAASAYMQSSAAGAEAEAREKAAHDATGKGISVEDQYRRQLAVTVSTGIMDGAKAAAQLEDEASAHSRVLAAITAGTVGYGAMNDAIADDAKLRPLLIAQTNATGDAAITAAAAVASLTKALNDNHAASERFAATQAIHSTDDSIIGLRDQADFAGDRTGKGQIEIARRAAEREAADKYSHLADDDPKRTAYVEDKVSEARTKQTTDGALFSGQTLNSQQDVMAMAQAQLATLHMTADARELILDHLKAEQDLTAHLIPLDSDQAKAVLAGVDAAAKMNGQVQKQTAAWQEVQQTGDKVIDDIFNPKGDKLKTLLADVREELEKMALINPLKNLLLGENNPTISSLFGGGSSGGGLSGISGLFGRLKGLFGGGNPFSAVDATADTSIASIIAANPIHFASGTESSPAGFAEVGENGPELLNLPGGSRVINAADTRRLLQAGNDNGGTQNHFHLEGAVVTQDLVDQMNAVGSRATVRGATGGARLASDNLARSRRRSLSNA